MLHYKNYIRECIKKKYSESTFTNQKLYDSFCKSRVNFLKYCFKNLNKIKKNTPRSNDHVYKSLKKLHLKKKLTFLEKKKIFNYYVKFNVHLRLLKKNGKKTNDLSYLYLGCLSINLKNLNKIQKLNCILKIIDILYLSKKISINIQEFRLLIFLINFEKKCLKQITSRH